MEIVTKNISVEMIQEALQLDRKYYPPQYYLTLEQCLRYYSKNNQIYSMLVDGGRVVGYLNFSPITEQKYEEIASGACLDTSIEGEDIETYRPGLAYSAYLSSIVIEETYRSRGLANLLMRTLADKIVQMRRDGIVIKRIIADVLNDAGKKLASNFGLREKKATQNDSTLYEAVLCPMSLAPTPYNQKIIEAYLEGDAQ